MRHVEVVELLLAALVLPPAMAAAVMALPLLQSQLHPFSAALSSPHGLLKMIDSLNFYRHRLCSFYCPLDGWHAASPIEYWHSAPRRQPALSSSVLTLEGVQAQPLLAVLSIFGVEWLHWCREGRQRTSTAKIR